MTLVDPSLAVLCAPVDPGGLAEMVRAAGFDPKGYHNQFMRIVGDSDPTEHFMLRGAGRLVCPGTLDIMALRRLSGTEVTNRIYLSHLVASVVAGWTAGLRIDLDQHVDSVFSVLAELMELGAAPILIIGDSHSTLYHRPFVRGERWTLPIRLLCGGGSAMGLKNPASRSGYGRKIKRLLASVDGNIPIMFKFGQVDTEFVYTFQRIRDGAFRYDRVRYEAFCANSVSAYFEFLTETVMPELRHQVYIATVFPSSLSDVEWRSGYTNGAIVNAEADRDEAAVSQAIREMEIPDMFERARIHALYNSLLVEQATAAGFRSLDDFHPFLSSHGVLDARFTGGAQGRDHHMHGDPVSPVLSAVIWGMLAEYASSDLQGPSALPTEF